MDTIYIKTGKDLLDSKIKHFKVVNGSWIGKVEIRNNHPWLYAYEKNGELMNSFEIENNMILDLHIKRIYMRRNKSNELYNKALEEFSELVKSHLSIQGSFGSEDADTIKNQLKLK